MNQDVRKGLLWTIRILLAITFVLTGGPKILKDVHWVNLFDLWGFPGWFRMLVGWAEILGALALVNNRTALFAAAGLAMVMFGATITQFVHGSLVAAAIPLGMAILLIVVALAHRPQLMKGEQEENEYRDYEGEPDRVQV